MDHGGLSVAEDLEIRSTRSAGVMRETLDDTPFDGNDGERETESGMIGSRSQFPSDICHGGNFVRKQMPKIWSFTNFKI